MSAPSSPVELVVDARADVGEGPVWDDRCGRLLWVDITPGLLHTLDPRSGSTTAHPAGQALGSVAMRARGGLVLALRDGLHALHAADAIAGPIEPLLPIDADRPLLSLNDSACDSAGRLWVGSVSDGEEPGSGRLYRVDPDLRVTPVLDGTTLANGIGWSPDERTMYFVDSTALTVFAFDYDLSTGTPTGRRVLARTAEPLGLPDGLAVDEEGFVWVAYWGGWCVRRYAPDGSLNRVVELPVAQVSSCGFGGDDLGDLYVTTAAFELGPGELARQPAAGGLFRLRPGNKGLPAHRFGG
jgi:sugar lactone lactonase YvrE